MPEVTFIVPTYKRPQLLLRCLTSIKTFLTLDHEIIVVDDSQEGEGYGPAMSAGATYVKKSSADRRGLAANRNIGLSFAKGDFVIFIDDDDFYVGDAVQTMVRNAEGNDFLCSNYFTYFGDDNLRPSGLKQFNMDDMLIRNRFPVGSFAVRRSAIRYGFDEEMASHEDWDFLLRHLFLWKVKFFDCFSVAIDKTNNISTSHQGLTRRHWWVDFVSIYSRYRCPRLSHLRSAQLKSLGINIPPESLEFEPFINQRPF